VLAGAPDADGDPDLTDDGVLATELRKERAMAAAASTPSRPGKAGDRRGAARTARPTGKASRPTGKRRG
jgi:preprotein translocase subunit SecF